MEDELENITTLNDIYNDFVIEKDKFSNAEGFIDMYKDASPEELFELVDQNSFTDVNQFAEMFELVEEKEKNTELSPLTGALDWLKKSYQAYFPDEKKKKEEKFPEVKKNSKGVYINIATGEEAPLIKKGSKEYKDYRGEQPLDMTNSYSYDNYGDLITSPDFFADKKNIDYSPQNIYKSLKDNIGKYGFVLDNPNVALLKDALTGDLKTMNLPLKGSGNESVTVVSTNGLNTFNIKLKDGAVQNQDEFDNFLEFWGQNPAAPAPNDEVIAKSLKVKESRSGARWNSDTKDYSSVLMSTVEMDGVNYALPSLFPKNPDAQSTYSEDWIEFNPKTQTKEMIALARERGELYAFDTKDQADDFAGGLWKEANTVDLEKQLFFKRNGIDNYTSIFKAVNEYEKARDEVFFIDNLKKIDMSMGDLAIKTGDATPINRNVPEVTEEEKLLYPYLFDEDGKLRTDIQAYRKKRDEQRDNLYNITQDENFVATTIAWDIEAAKRRQVYIDDAYNIDKQAQMSEVVLNNFAIEKFGKKISNLPLMISEGDYNEEDISLVNFMVAAKAQIDMDKKYAADQFFVSKTYLDSKNLKSAQGKVLKGMWNNVSNEWNTRRKRGEAGKVILAMGVSDSPTETEDILGMSREEAAKYITDKLMESTTSSRGTSVEMLEWNRSKGFRESLDVLLDNPLDMALSLSAGSFSEILPYGVQMVLGAGLMKGTIDATLMKGPPQARAIAGVKGLVQGMQVGAAGTLVAMEYTNAAFEAMTLKGYDIASPESVLKAVQDDKVWTEARNVGLARGIPIAIIDYFTARMAGRILMGRSSFGWKKFGLLATERAVFDPGGEAYGEYLAQLNNQLLNDKEFRAEEIGLEAIGAFGSNSSNMVMNGFVTALKNERIIAGERMSGEQGTANYSQRIGNSEQVSNWANSMQETKLLSPSTVQDIQENIGAKREAKTLMQMNDGQVTNSKDLPIQTTMMELIRLQNQLSISPTSTTIFGKEIGLIKQALNTLATNKVFNPEDEDIQALSQLSNKLFNKPFFNLETKELTDVKGTVIEEEIIETETEVENTSEMQTEVEENQIAAEDLSVELEDLNNEILSVKQQLKEELKAPGLTKEQKIDLREDAKSQIQSYKEDIKEAKRKAKRGNVSLSQKNISELFTDDQTSNTNVVAFSKVPLSAIKDKRIPGGTTRDVYDIGNDRVIKIAKNPRGLQQNASIGYGDANILGGKVPEIYEVGTDYIVVENVPRNDKSVREYLKPLQKFTQKDFDDRGGEIQEVMEEMGLSDFFNYDVLWNDFTSRRNWGQRKNGEFVLVDEGTLNKNVTATSSIPDWARQEWSEVKRDRKGGSDVSLSQRRIPLKNLLLDYGYDTETGFFPNTISNISPLKKGLQTFGYDLITNNDEVTGKVTGYHIAQEGGKRKLDLFKGEKLKREARQGKEVSPETRKELVELLSKAFPGVKVFDNVEAFEKNINQPGVVKRQTKDGYIAYGAKGDGSIYLNPDDKTLTLPLHEFGHMFIDYLKSKRSGEKGSSLYKRGLQLITSTEKGQEEYDKQVKIYGEGRKAREEALVEYIANEGRRRAEGAQQSQSVKDKLAKWFDLLMAFVKKQFMKLKDLFSSKTFAQDIKGMSLEDFVNMSLRELLGGQVIDENVGVEIEQDGQMRLPSLSQQEIQVPEGTDIDVIVKKSRDLGIIDSQIREVLKGRNNFSVEQINDALAFEMIEGQTLPLAFRDMKGGSNIGLALFTETFNKVLDFIGKGTTTQVRKKHIEKIKRKYPAATKGLTVQQILRKYPVNTKLIAAAKTPAEVREFAKKSLESNPMFASQSQEIQDNLVIAFDRSVGISANKDVQKEIRELRSKLQVRRNTEKSIQKVKSELNDYIKLNFPKGLLVPRAVMTKLNKLIAGVNKKNYLRQVESVIQEIDTQNEKIKSKVIDKIKKLIDTNARTGTTASNKTRKSTDIDVTTKEFFIAAKKLIDAYITGDVDVFFNEIIELSALEDTVRAAISNPTNKAARDLVARADAFAILGGLPTMSLQEVEQVFEDLKNQRAIGREQYAEDQAKRKEEVDKLKTQADAQITKTNPELFLPDGTPVNTDNLSQQRRKQILDGFDTNGKNSFINSMKSYVQTVAGQKLSDFVREIKLQTKDMLAAGNLFYNSLDSRQGKFFTDEFFYRLTDANEIYHQIFQGKQNAMSDIANEIYKKKKYPNVLGRLMGADFGNVSAYQYIKQLAETKGNITLKNINKQGFDGETTSVFTTDEALRMYALSQNPRGRRILLRDGVDDKVITQIEKFIGKEMISFVDNVIDYLNTVGYEQANDIHRTIFGVNLPYEENYFPQATESRSVKNKDGETSTRPSKGESLSVDPQSPLSTIQAFAPDSFSERTKNEEDLRMILNLGFFQVLDNYLEQTSRFEAYAEPAKILEQVLRIPSVKALLDFTGLKKSVVYNINVELDPKGITRGVDKAMIISRGVNLMTSYYLSLKLMQVPKQASSYVLAYPLYTAGKYSVYKKRIAGDPIFEKNRNVILQVPELLAQALSSIPSEAITFAEFNAKAVKYFANYNSSVAKMRKISATLNSRALEAAEGNIYALYSGREIEGTPEMIKKYGASYKLIAQTFGYFTNVGDIGGIIGYLIVYDELVDNQGFSHEDALRVFNDYNLTNQSRRGIDKVGIQSSKNGLAKLFTSFTSSPIQLANNTYIAASNISKDTAQNKVPDMKDVRALGLNASLSTMYFLAIGNIALLLLGKSDKDDDFDDREKFWERVTKMYGLIGLVNAIPTLGQAIQTFINEKEGKGWKKADANITSPLNEFAETFGAILNEENKDDPILIPIMYELMQFAMGVQLTPIEAAYNMANDQDHLAYWLLTFAGISPGSIPERFKPKKKKKKKYNYNQASPTQRRYDSRQRTRNKNYKNFR